MQLAYPFYKIILLKRHAREPLLHIHFIWFARCVWNDHTVNHCCFFAREGTCHLTSLLWDRSQIESWILGGTHCWSWSPIGLGHKGPSPTPRPDRRQSPQLEGSAPAATPIRERTRTKVRCRKRWTPKIRGSGPLRRASMGCTTPSRCHPSSSTPAPPPYAYDSKPTVWLSLNPVQVHTR
jgi:hypothetical protein